MSTRSTHVVEPCPCPRCKRAGAQPFRLAPGEEEAVRVLLRCDWCHHRWSTIVASDDVLVTGNKHLWITK